MTKKLYLTTGLFILALWNIEIPKRAFRHYERGDISKTVEALDKSIAKDSLNPASYYLYALLYTDTAFSRYDVDSAYLYTNKAYDQLSLVTDPKDIEDLKEFSVDSATLEAYKDKVDSLKFEEIKQLHTIKDYNWFVTKHNDAKEIPEAIRLRNHIAFEQASEVNTWQSYQGFMKAYPDAEDFREADSRYKRLIYEERTADGKYESLTSFLEDFPNTPYRLQVEDAILPYATDINTLESFVDYLNTYPNQKHARILFDRAYHIYKTKYPDGDFFEDFDFGVATDSLKNARKLEKGSWLPKLEDGKITFMDLTGNSMLETPFNTLDEECLCSPISEDFVFGKVDEEKLIIGRNGAKIFRGQFEAAIDAAYGFIIVRNVEGDRLILKSGTSIIDDPKEEIAILDNRFVRIKENGFYGLQSIHGNSYLANEYVKIDTFKTFFWLEKEDGLALVKPETLLESKDKKPYTFQAQYDELEELPNGMIWAMRNNEETILDQQFKTIIPFAKHEIYERSYGWQVETDEDIKLIHDLYDSLLNDAVFDRVLENDKWLGLKKGNSWLLLDQMGNLPPSKNYDSLAFWGENMVMLFRNDSSWAQFGNGKQLLMTDKWKPQLLIPQRYISTGEKATRDFFMLSNEKKYRRIYNSHGREILKSTYQDVVALGPNMLKLQKRNAALADSTGYFILNFIYDGIGSNNQGYVSILDKGKVGIINPARNIKLPPSYEKLLEPYADTVLIASEGSYKGFINTKGEVLTGFEFDEVQYYNDTVALCRIEDEWLVYDVSGDVALYEGILEYEHIHNDDIRKTLLVTTETGKGIFSLEKQEIIEPTYTDIKLLGTPEVPIYFAMKLVEEADIYVVIYFDQFGNKLFTQSFRQDEYYRIACPVKP